MKILDSLKHSKWKGNGFNLQNNSILVLKSANLFQHFNIVKGKYKIKILGKKRTGNGKLYLEILSERNEIFLKQEINFTTSTMSESTFDFEINRNVGPGMIRLSRDKNLYGSIEIGRIFVDLITEEDLFTKLTPKVKIREQPKVSKQYLRSMKNFSHYWNQNEKSLAFIIPYHIYGGAEVYLQNLINEMPNGPQITILYLSENMLQNKITKSGVNHKIFKNLAQLRAHLQATDFDAIIFYNRLEVYQCLIDLKQKQEINSQLIEIYHSDFTWPGSLSQLKSRQDLDKLIVVTNSLGTDILGSYDREVIPIGIDLELFQYRRNLQLKTALNLDSYTKIIGCVARLSKEKNLDYCLALAKLLPEYGFVIVGDGPEQLTLQQKIIDQNLINVRLVGFQKSVSEYYNIFDGFVLASAMEGTPISILEAMASGVVVFSNLVGAISDIVQDGVTGIKICGEPERDLKTIVKNIERTDLTTQARDFIIAHHDIKHNAQHFLNYLFSGVTVLTERQDHMILLPGQYI